jgi:membrane protease YdiL (CAAX protease family)
MDVPLSVGAVEKSKDTHMRITWLLVAGLFILRIPLLTFLPMLDPDSYDWVDPLYVIGTYFLAALLIWWERERLADFHVDKLVLVIFIFGMPLYVILERLDVFDSPPQSPAYLLCLPTALGLGIALLRTRPQFPQLSSKLWRWMIIGFVSGVALAAYFGSILTRTLPGWGHVTPTPALLILLPLRQMFTAALVEEIFFRGFLWGSLRKAGIKDVWCWLIQAGLFWLGHAYALLYAPFSFWMLVPVGGLVLGWLAWRSRSIGPGILAHGLANGWGPFM